LSIKHLEALKNEETSMLHEIRQRTQGEVFEISRKVLNDLAATSLEERLCAVFIRRLKELDSQSRSSLMEAIKSSSEPVLVRSVFELPSAQRTEIQNALNETFATRVNVRFETAPDLIGGIELSKNGHKVEWSIASYLYSMEKSLNEVVK